MKIRKWRTTRGRRPYRSRKRFGWFIEISRKVWSRYTIRVVFFLYTVLV